MELLYCCHLTWTALLCGGLQLLEESDRIGLWIMGVALSLQALTEAARWLLPLVKTQGHSASYSVRCDDGGCNTDGTASWGEEEEERGKRVMTVICISECKRREDYLKMLLFASAGFVCHMQEYPLQMGVLAHTCSLAKIWHKNRLSGQIFIFSERDFVTKSATRKNLCLNTSHEAFPVIAGQCTLGHLKLQQSDGELRLDKNNTEKKDLFWNAATVVFLKK